jgi:hypothetical protein
MLVSLFAQSVNMRRFQPAATCGPLLGRSRKEPQALGAWEYAMRAQWHLAKDLVEARRLAAKSTALDPGATLGFNIAAFAHIHEIHTGWSSSLPQSVLAAYETASKAVTVDSRDAVSQKRLAIFSASSPMQTSPRLRCRYRSRGPRI